MQLDKLTVNVRPINATHALDLGMAMARAWYGDLFRLALTGILPVVLLLSLLLGLSAWMEYLQAWQMWLAILIVALRRSMVEAHLLLFMSQKLFDEDFDYQAFKRMPKPSMKAVISLLPRAISTKRHLYMAARLLEAQTGKALRPRVRVLSRSSDGSLFLFGLLFWALELMLLLGVVLLIAYSLGSTSLGQTIFVALEELYTTPIWLMVLAILLYGVVVCVLMPFFVAGGFSVYVCRRSLLEAWDVELVFRKMIARYHAQNQHTQSQHAQNRHEQSHNEQRHGQHNKLPHQRSVVDERTNQGGIDV